MAHSGGDVCFVVIVHSRWVRVVQQPRVVVEFASIPVANPAVTRNSSQSVSGA